MKCIREHCEFSSGGYCAMVCPKNLSDRIEKKNAIDKINTCVAMLKRVKERIPKQPEPGEFPKGIYFNGKNYRAYISYNRKQMQLGIRETLEEAAQLRADAEKAKQNGNFENYLANLRAENKKQGRRRGRPKKAVK